MKNVSARKRVGPAKPMMSLAAITMVGVVGVVGTRAALSATTDNPGNEFNAGEIDLADNDTGTFLYNVDNALPGDSVEKCIQVTYNSTGLDSNVELYTGTPIGTAGTDVVWRWTSARRPLRCSRTAPVSPRRRTCSPAPSPASRRPTVPPDPASPIPPQRFAVDRRRHRGLPGDPDAAEHAAGPR